MAELAKRLLDLNICSFLPDHHQKLAEEEAGVVSDLLVKRACFNLLTKKLIEILFALL